MRQIDCLAGGIDDEHQVIAAVGDHDVVQNSAGLVRQQRVALPPVGKAGNVNRDQPFERASGVFKLPGYGTHGDLAHMRDVEKAGRGTGM